MNNIIDLSAKEVHGGKAVELKMEPYVFSLWVKKRDTGAWNSIAVDEEILDMILNVVLEFKEKLAETRLRSKHVS